MSGLDWIGLDGWISLNRLTTRSPYGDKKSFAGTRLPHTWPLCIKPLCLDSTQAGCSSGDNFNNFNMRERYKFGNFGTNLATLLQLWYNLATLVQFGNFGNFGTNLATLVQFGNIGNFGTNLATLVQFGNFGTNLATLVQIWYNLVSGVPLHGLVAHGRPLGKLPFQKRSFHRKYCR